MTTALVPETAPFNDEQRAWLNGFLSGLMGMQTGQAAPTAEINGIAQQALNGQRIGTATTEEEDLDEAPWHDASLPILDRMALADGRPKSHKLMAAMAQLDCGSCGYLCKTYSQAIASGEETNLTLCSPGGKETKQMIKKVMQETDASEPKNGTSARGVAEIQAAAKPEVSKSSTWSRKNPFPARLLESRPLNASGSAKDTRHIVIDLADSGMEYQVGDALGIYPSNCPELAASIVQRLAAEAHTQVLSPLGVSKSLKSALSEDCCLRDPTDELLELLVDRVDDPGQRSQLAALLDHGTPDGCDVLEILDIAQGARITATEFIETLSPLNPRLYSIASSMRLVGKQVHLTVGKVAYQRGDRLRKGVASTMLADRLPVGAILRVFTQPNHGGFTVPADPNAPMIMVGPGTGVAPFVAFLQERAANASNGENWLFFGDQHASTDFLYETELREFQKTGLLTRLDTAFSRDGESKTYVQHRMRENSLELWQWLQRGAHFYVCGDASRMAKDVEQTLKEVVALHGQMTDSQAHDYVKKLAADQRYVRDVY